MSRTRLDEDGYLQVSDKIRDISKRQTLRVYADLFDTDIDAVATTLHSSYSPQTVGKL